MSAPTITRAMLRGACRTQQKIFRDTFGESVEVTEENVLRAVGAGLDLDWGRKWFTPSARKAYTEAIAPARKAYHEAIAPAEEAYEKAVDSAWKAYTEAIAPARKAYHEAIAPARKAYHEAIAPAWTRAYLESVGAPA